MGKSRIHFLPLLIEHNIGKVVILIYYKIKWKIFFSAAIPMAFNFLAAVFAFNTLSTTRSG